MALILKSSFPHSYIRPPREHTVGEPFIGVVTDDVKRKYPEVTAWIYSEIRPLRAGDIVVWGGVTDRACVLEVDWFEVTGWVLSPVLKNESGVYNETKV